MLQYQLDFENDEMTDEWQSRCNEYLTIAKKNGKNRMYFGQDLKKLELNKVKTLNKIDIIEDNKEDDLITLKSLQSLQVKFFCQFS